MISEDAVEAAVDALVASRLGDHKGINGEEFVEAARLALEAAAPHIKGEGWDEGYTAGHSRAMRMMSDEPKVEPGTNPYRSQA